MGWDNHSIFIGTDEYYGKAYWTEQECETIEDEVERELKACLDVVYGCYECGEISKKLRNAIFMLSKEGVGYHWKVTYAGYSGSKRVDTYVNIKFLPERQLYGAMNLTHEWDEGKERWIRRGEETKS